MKEREPVGAGGPGTGGTRYLRHTAWNVASIAIPLVVGLAAFPVLARALGPARLGLLALAWALLEYLTVFDFGLVRATTRHVAQRLRSPEPALNETVTASLLAQLSLGVVAGALLAALTPVIVGRVLRVPAELVGEAERALLVLALTMPFVLLALALRSLLEAAERFDLVAAVRAPSSAATLAVPAIAAAYGATLPQILALLMALRVVTCVATWWLARRAIPSLRLARPRELGELRALAGVGGWIAVSNLLSPLFLYFDRLALGALVGMVAVGFYAGPFELAMRMLVLPAVVVASVFPAASALSGERRQAELQRLYSGSAGAILLILLPVVVVGVIWARPIIGLWLGETYVDPGATVLRLLLPGVLVGALSHVPATFLQAGGRADVSGRLHLGMAVVHVTLSTIFILRFGAVGAAAAWSIRAAIDMVAFFVFSARVLHLRPTTDLGGAAVLALLRKRATVGVD